MAASVYLYATIHVLSLLGIRHSQENFTLEKPASEAIRKKWSGVK